MSAPVRVGLTGGIGSGKSTALHMLGNLGAAMIDADALSRRATAQGGAAIDAIREHFGAAFITADGALDRVWMRDRVYADPQARGQLEGIIHPWVGQESAAQVQAALDAGARCIVFDIPLLVESGRWREQVDRVLVMDCEPQTQVQRVGVRSGLPPEEVRAIMAAQAPRRLRLAAADMVIYNEGLSLEQLGHMVVQIGRRLGL